MSRRPVVAPNPTAPSRLQYVLEVGLDTNEYVAAYDKYKASQEEEEAAPPVEKYPDKLWVQCSSLPLLALPVDARPEQDIGDAFGDAISRRKKTFLPWFVLEYKSGRSVEEKYFPNFPETEIAASPTGNFIFTLKIGTISWLRFRYELKFGREYQIAWQNGNNKNMMAAAMSNWRSLLPALTVELLEERRYGRVAFSNDIAAALGKSSYSQLEKQMRERMTGKYAYNDTRKKFLTSQPGAIRLFAWAAVSQAFSRCGKRLGLYKSPPSVYVVPYVETEEE